MTVLAGYNSNSFSTSSNSSKLRANVFSENKVFNKHHKILEKITWDIASGQEWKSNVTPMYDM